MDDTGSTCSISTGTSSKPPADDSAANERWFKAKVERGKLRKKPVDVSKVVIDVADILDRRQAQSGNPFVWLHNAMMHYIQQEKDVIAVVPSGNVEGLESILAHAYDVVVVPKETCCNTVLSVARTKNCPFLTNRDLKAEVTAGANNFLRALPALHIQYAISASGEVYPDADIDDLVLPTSAADFLPPLGDAVHVAQEAYDGLEVHPSDGQVERGYLKLDKGDQVRLRGAATAGHTGNKHAQYVYGIIVGQPNREGWLPREILVPIRPPQSSARALPPKIGSSSSIDEALRPQSAQSSPHLPDEMHRACSRADVHPEHLESPQEVHQDASAVAEEDRLGRRLRYKAPQETQQDGDAFKVWDGKWWQKQPDGIWKCLKDGSVWDPQARCQWFELHIPNLGFAEHVDGHIEELRESLAKFTIKLGKCVPVQRPCFEGPLPIMDVVVEDAPSNQEEIAPWYLLSAWIKCTEEQCDDLLRGSLSIELSQPTGPALQLKFVWRKHDKAPRKALKNAKKRYATTRLAEEGSVAAATASSSSELDSTSSTSNSIPAACRSIVPFTSDRGPSMAASDSDWSEHCSSRRRDVASVSAPVPLMTEPHRVLPLPLANSTSIQSVGAPVSAPASLGVRPQIMSAPASLMTNPHCVLPLPYQKVELLD